MDQEGAQQLSFATHRAISSAPNDRANMVTSAGKRVLRMHHNKLTMPATGRMCYRASGNGPSALEHCVSPAATPNSAAVNQEPNPSISRPKGNITTIGGTGGVAPAR